MIMQPENQIYNSLNEVCLYSDTDWTLQTIVHHQSIGDYLKSTSDLEKTKNLIIKEIIKIALKLVEDMEFQVYKTTTVC